MPNYVPTSGFTEQVEEFAKQLAHLTDDQVQADDDRASPLRSTSYLVAIPDVRTGVTTTFDYREEFKKITGGWLRVGYTYELRVSRRPNSTKLHARRAHHEHEPWGFHQHCETPSRPDSHYADVERLLQATHELFVQQFATGSPIDCSGLVPLTTR